MMTRRRLHKVKGVRKLKCLLRQIAELAGESVGLQSAANWLSGDPIGRKYRPPESPRWWFPECGTGLWRRVVEILNDRTHPLYPLLSRSMSLAVACDLPISRFVVCNWDRNWNRRIYSRTPRAESLDGDPSDTFPDYKALHEEEQTEDLGDVYAEYQDDADGNWSDI